MHYFILGEIQTLSLLNNSTVRVTQRNKYLSDNNYLTDSPAFCVLVENTVLSSTNDYLREIKYGEVSIRELFA